jgi:uncharacterized protein
MEQTSPTDFSLKLFLLKVQARCNLNCSYCYEFNSPDQSWRSHPALMSTDVLRHTAARIATHVVRHQLSQISIVFHGGEPLLAPLAWYEEAFRIFAAQLPAGLVVNYTLQTNGILLSDAYLNLFERHRVSVGISLDGTRSANDRHRVDRKGRSSFDKVMNGIRLLQDPAHRSVSAGLLSVINPLNDPLETYQFLSSLGLPSVDFLFPHYHHDNPPPFAVGEISQWLITIFDAWWDADSPVRIRLFEDSLHLLLGGRYSCENMGLAPVELLVVQTDGRYEAVDSLKSTVDGAVFTGKNIMDHDFDEVLSHPLIGPRMDRASHLPTICKKCPLKNVCGGGYIPHRYSKQHGFDNPSIYCQDLQHFYGHISRRLSEAMTTSEENVHLHA